jgi:hypothetical protein
LGGLVDAFNFAFSLFAIVLGLSLVEVLTGFARALRRRRMVHLGWLVPLLAIFVMLDLNAFWQWAWSGRRLINPGYGILTIGLFVSGLYYLAASIVFPSEFGDRADFDEHYIAHRRQVLGAIFICNVITSVPVIVIRWGEAQPRLYFEWAIYFGALLVAIVSRSKKVSIAMLSLLIGQYLFAAVMSFIQPPPM